MKSIYWVEIFGVVFSIFVIFYFWFAVSYLKKKDEERRRTQVVLKVRKTKSRRLYKLYKYMAGFRLTRKYVLRLQRMYEIRIPGDIRQTREKAARMALVIYAICLTALIILVFVKPSLLAWSTIIYSAYVFCDQIIQSNVHKLDLQLISELSTFIDDVRHQYFVHGMVDESIEASLEKAPPLMKLHGQKILDIIRSDVDMLGELEKYCDVVPSYYLKMFADTCAKIMQYGDKTVDDQSLFLLSVQNLKEEIQMEQLRQKGLANKFRFLTGISVVPVYAISPLEGFGVSGFSALRDLFYGSYGVWGTIISFAVSFAVYKIINRLRSSVHVDLQDRKGWKTLYRIPPIRKTVNNFLTKDWGRTLRLRDLLKKTGSSFDVRVFTTRCFTIFLAVFFGFIALSVAAHWQNKRVAGSNVTAVASTTSGASDEECLMMLLIARQLLEDYKDVDARGEYNVMNPGNQTMEFDSDVETYFNEKLMDVVASGMEIDEGLAYGQLDAFLGNHDSTTLSVSSLKGLSYAEASTSEDPMVAAGFHYFQGLVELSGRDDLKLTEDERKALVKETVKQIRKYQNEYFHWYEVIIAFIMAVIGYNLPTWILMYERKALQMDMEDEVIQYKSAIMLLMHIDRMNTEVILESLLLIARIFRQSLQDCMNNLPLNEDKAYDKLEEDEPFDAFKRLVENMRMVDKVGVKRAFSTVTSERKNYQEKRKQENEINVRERGALAEFISMLPAYAVIFAFMVVPYIIEAISEFSHALADMQTYM